MRNAEFGFRGPGRLLDPFVAVGFRIAGRRAVAGLQDHLNALAST